MISKWFPKILSSFVIRKKNNLEIWDHLSTWESETCLHLAVTEFHSRETEPISKSYSNFGKRWEKLPERSQCLKITKNVSFWVFQKLAKLTIFGIFDENVIVARYARNVEWDFFCDFKTPWIGVCVGSVWVVDFSLCLIIRSPSVHHPFNEIMRLIFVIAFGLLFNSINTQGIHFYVIFPFFNAF